MSNYVSPSPILSFSAQGLFRPIGSGIFVIFLDIFVLSLWISLLLTSQL